MFTRVMGRSVTLEVLANETKRHFWFGNDGLSQPAKTKGLQCCSKISATVDYQILFADVYLVREVPRDRRPHEPPAGSKQAFLFICTENAHRLTELWNVIYRRRLTKEFNCKGEDMTCTCYMREEPGPWDGRCVCVCGGAGEGEREEVVRRSNPWSVGSWLECSSLSLPTHDIYTWCIIIKSKYCSPSPSLHPPTHSAEKKYI